MTHENAFRPRLHARAEGGSVVFETALSAILVFTIMFGLMEVSLALYSYHFIAEAAREGTRFAIVRGSSCEGFGSACPAGAGDVQTYLRNLGSPGINPNAMTVTTTWPTTGSTCTPSANPCNNPGNLVQVKVSYQFPLNIPFVPTRTLTMGSTSEMVISQ